MRGLLLILLAWATGTTMAAAALNPGQTAVAYYLLCREVPVDLNKINALRSTSAVEADRKLAKNILQARAGVLSAVGGNGQLATVQVLSERTVGERSWVAVVLSYYNHLPPRKLEIDLIKEDGVWKVAN